MKCITVFYKTKVYDGTTDGEWESVEFLKSREQGEVLVELTPYVDFTVGAVHFKGPNADVWNNCKSEVELTDSERAKNYVLVGETVKSGGVILPAPIANCHDMTVYVRYNDTSVHTYDATGFGTPNDEKTYGVYTRHDKGTGFDIISQIPIYGQITLQLKDNLTPKDIGKKCTVYVRIQTTDENYSTDPENKDTLLFTVVVVDKYTPELSVEPITAVYDGNAISADAIKVNGTATYEGKEVAGTWSWENPQQAPKNVGDSGEHTVVFTPSDKELYVEKVTKKVNVTITPRDIGDKDITFSYFGSFVYTGQSTAPRIDGAYKYDENLEALELIEDKDYTLTYPEDVTNVGKKKITVTGRGNFGGTTELEYEITPCTQVPVLTLSQTEYIYDGGEKKPVVTVTVEGRTLTEGQDYEVAYANNTNAMDGAKVTVTSKGNYGFAAAEQGFTIRKAPIRIQPQDAVKTYGQAAALRYTLSGGDFLTAAELDEIDKLVVLTSDGTDETAAADANGYAISAQLKQAETANLLLSIEGTAKVVVNKAPLTVKVKDVSREYGAENPPLEAEYSGFVNGEDESVLKGELQLNYADGIGAQTPVGPHPDAAVASGLDAENYEITYETGTLTVTKIGVAASSGAAGSSYLNILLDREIEGLTVQNFTVCDGEKAVGLTGVRASLNNKTYTLYGSFKMNKTYTVTVNLSGALADATHQMTVGEVDITPRQTGSSSGTSSNKITYTVTFETNGGSKIQPQVVAQNNAVTKPNDPTKEGFDFAGWYTDKALTKAYDFAEKATKSMTLFAAWTEQDDTLNQIILTIGEKTAQVFGRTVTNDVAPLIQNDRTMLPARFVAENLGAKVTWDADKRLVTVTGKNLQTDETMTILLTIDSDAAYVNGEAVKLDSPAFIDNDRTYTPVRFIAEALGAEVSWAEGDRQVIITK